MLGKVRDSEGEVMEINFLALAPYEHSVPLRTERAALFVAANAVHVWTNPKLEICPPRDPDHPRMR